MSDTDWIAYVGPFDFPVGEAASARVFGIARALAMGGARVVVGSGGTEPAGNQVLYREGEGVIAHVGLGELPSPEASPARRQVRYLITYGLRTLRWLKAQPSPPSAVILYGGYSPFMARLHPWCRRHGIPLIPDIVEWYQPHHLPGGAFGPFRWNIELAMRRLYAGAGSVIAISRYLQRYYEAKGCRALRVPPTLDVAAAARGNGPPLGCPLTLAYTGIPGKKDLLGDIIEAVLATDVSGARVKLVIAGPSAADILRYPALRKRGLSVLPASLEALGRVPHAEALNVVRRADFSVLLRPALRYAQAGFPTKVPESLAAGTPIICNLTSDLGECLHDGEEALICEDHSAAAFAAALERALSLGTSQKQAMRDAARAQAERAFDYRDYARPLATFVEGARSAMGAAGAEARARALAERHTRRSTDTEQEVV